MEVIQAGLLGKIREVHCWINRTFPPSAPIDTNADPIPDGLNWDFWCGPSPLLPFKNYYLARGCLALGPLAGVRRRPPGRHGRPRPESALAGVEARRAGARRRSRSPSRSRTAIPRPPTSAGTSPPAKASTPVTRLVARRRRRPVRRRNWARNCCRPTARCRATACCSPARRACSAPTPGASAAWSSSRATRSAAACRTTRPASRSP